MSQNINEIKQHLTSALFENIATARMAARQYGCYLVETTENGNSVYKFFKNDNEELVLSLSLVNG